MIQYILITCIAFFIIVFVFIKLKYPFWNNQPIFHRYDYWRYFYTVPFVIYKYRPVKTKFCDFINIKTVDYLEASDTDKANIINLLQCYYIPTERIIHNIHIDDITTYLTGQLDTSFI